MKRALRMSKLPLAALEATLQLYLRPERLTRDLPTLRLLTRSVDDIRAMAQVLQPLVAQAVQGQAQGFDTMAALPSRPFPGGAMFRWPMLVAGMSWYSLRDRLGF